MDFVRIEFSSSDAQTAAAIKLYNPDNVEVTLSGTQRLLINNLVVCVNGAITVELFDDANAGGTVNNGERLLTLVGIASQTIVVVVNYAGEGQFCGKARMPKVIASSSGQVTITGSGIVLRA